MFQGCSNLTSLDLSNFDTSNVTDMHEMFEGCPNLTSLDLSSFNTSNVTRMDEMFGNCSSLATITVSDLWSTVSVTEGDEMFIGCTNLVGGNGTVYDPNHTDYTYARIDRVGEPGYLTDINASVITKEPYAVLSNDNTVLTFYYDEQKESRGGMSVGPFSNHDERGWYGSRETITSVVFDVSFADCSSITSTRFWFNRFENLVNITGL